MNETLSEHFETLAERNKHATELICNQAAAGADQVMDQDGRVHDTLAHTLEPLETLRGLMLSRQQAANQDRPLRAEDGVVEFFDQVIAGICHAHSSINELLWAVLEHDADCSPPSGKGPFSSVDQLLASIKS